LRISHKTITDERHVAVILVGDLHNQKVFISSLKKGCPADTKCTILAVYVKKKENLEGT
jgi:hypothetical protein